jgi:hypothetical protein
VRRLNGHGGATGDAVGVVAVVGVDGGTFKVRTRGASLVVAALLESAITARHRSYALAKDMAISMSSGFWSSTSVFRGLRRPAV